MADGWMGLKWSEWGSFVMAASTGDPGLYRLRLTNQTDLLYIGETRSLSSRLREHGRSLNALGAIEVSFAIQDSDISKCALREIENDLIGGYYEWAGVPPRMQFANGVASSPSATSMTELKPKESEQL